MKICIAHFRIGLTDGVSLEIKKRIAIMKELGNSVVTIADANADLVIPYFKYKANPEIVAITQGAFSDSQKVDDLQSSIEEIASEIETSLTDFYEKEKFESLWIHNIFSLPVCLPATLAFYRFLQKHPQVH